MRFFCCFARTTIASLTHLIDYPHFHFFPRDVSNSGGSNNIRAHYFVRQLITFWLVQPIWHSRWTMCRKGQKLLVQITLFTIWQAWRVPLLSFHFFLKNLPLLFTPGAYVSRLQINKFYFYRMTFTTTTTTCSTTTSTRQLFHVLVIFLELWRNFDPKWVVGTILWPIPNSLNAITVAKRLV